MKKHEHELRFDERTTRQFNSFAEALHSVGVELHIQRAFAPLPQQWALTPGVHISEVSIEMDTAQPMQRISLNITMTEEEMASYLALREAIIGRALAALEAPDATA